MEFRILGPLEVWVDGSPAPLGGPKQRAVLAILLLRANEVVSRDVLIDEVWAGRPPPSAGHTLEAYVHRLRKLLGDALVTRPPGYLLRVAPEQLDLHRFERLVDEASVTAAPERSAAKLHEALAIWRGPALADLELQGSTRVELDRLAELRETALEERIEADLACGRHRALVPELDALVARFPLRERLRGQLMLALHGCARQAEALEAYHEARRYLLDELGLEPSPELRAVQSFILCADPSPAEPLTPAARRRRSPRAVLIATLTSAVVVSALVLARGDDAPPAIRGNALLAIGLDDARIRSAVRLDTGPGALAAGFGSLWVTEFRRNTVDRIDAAGRVQQTIHVGSGPSGVAVGAGAVWVANHLDGTVSRIDPRTQAVVQSIDVAGAPTDVAIADGSVWVAGARGQSVARLDARSGRLERTITVGDRPVALAAGAGAVWVGGGRSVTRIDPRSGTVTANVPTGASDLAYGAGALWASDDVAGTVARIDPARAAVTATLEAGDGPAAVAVAGETVWVADEPGAAVAAIDPSRAAVTRRIALSGRPGAIGSAGGRLWVGVSDPGHSHRGGTLVLLNPARRFDSIDPAIQHNVLPAQLLGLTNDGLLTFKHAAGRDGARLVPDLAVSLPAPSANGRRYTFRLRPGIRYSTGEPVRAGDIRRGIERGFRLKGPGTSLYAGIVGAADCLRGRARCKLARGIVADDRLRTITFNLTAPDPDFPYKLALPFAYAVPPGTPDRDVGLDPIPATGPYEIASYVPGYALRLVRNRQFREWSNAARPDGYADEIVWRLGVSLREGIAAVLDGRADWIQSIGQALPEARLRDIERRFPSQLHVNPLMQTDYVILNVNVPPFDDVRVRRAVNYALDRRAVARLFGGTGAQPTCQVLPPQMPGYIRYCPYTRRPRADGAWRAPDLATARRLVAASGTRGMRVVLWNTPQPGTFLEEGRAAVALLRRLGYRASMRLVPDPVYARRSGNSRYRVQASSGGWSADYPSPSSFIELKLSCRAFVPDTDYNHNAGGFCDPLLDRRVARARRLQARRPVRAAGLWRRIERSLVDRAVWLPMVTPRTTDLVSRRAGNYQFHPLWGLLVDQLWVR
jgi:YVTN family beta-propeller protein